MKKHKPETAMGAVSRRDFLKTVGAGAPTVTVLAGEAVGVARTLPEPQTSEASDKFTPIDLAAHFNASSREFGQREGAWTLGGDCARDFLIRVPSGKRRLQGIPFRLGPADVDSKSWIVLSTKPGPNAVARVDILFGRKLTTSWSRPSMTLIRTRRPAPARMCSNKWDSIWRISLSSTKTMEPTPPPCGGALSLTG